MRTRTDKLLLVLTALFVAGLALGHGPVVVLFCPV